MQQLKEVSTNVIKTDTLTINNVQFVRTYSDSGHYVVRDSVSYEEAIDPAEFGRTYTEGDLISIEGNSIADEEEISAAQILDILLGEDND